jgi:hypothetical protein
MEGKMAKWVIYTLLGLLLSACPLSLACEHPQDVSRYTADQVIYVARAKSPSCIREGLTASWSAIYLDNHHWLVTKSCLTPRGELWSVTQWDFYEDNGGLNQR